MLGLIEFVNFLVINNTNGSILKLIILAIEGWEWYVLYKFKLLTYKIKEIMFDLFIPCFIWKLDLKILRMKET